jgi:predicted dehydrogenase
MAKDPLTRRGFLRTAAGAAAAAPALIPSTAIGQTAPSNRVTLASIGVGGRGSGLVNGFIRQEGAQFLAVCDCFADRRERMRDAMNTHYGANAVEAYADFRDVLARDDIDAVIIATPDHWHVPIALAAARAGQDMYVEKPLGVSMAWAKRLRRELSRHGRIFQYGTQQRSSVFYRRVWELVRNGYIGEVERVDAWCPDISSQYDAFHVKRYGSTEPVPSPGGFNYDMWLGPAPRQPYTVDRCTCFGAYHIYDYALGFIAGWGAHPLDAVQWVLGRDDTSPVRCQGTGSLPERGLFDTVEAWDMRCAYEDGLTIRFMDHRAATPVTTSYRPQSPNGITFFGSEGWVSCDRSRVCASDPKLVDAPLKETDARPPYTNDHARNFLQAVRERTPAISPFEAAIRSDAISHMCDISIRLGRALEWDPRAETFVGDDEANALLDRPLREPWDLDVIGPAPRA